MILPPHTFGGSAEVMNMVAEEHSSVVLLNTLTEALNAAAAALEGSAEQFLSVPDGISLLDIKNDLLLSYLQNLVLLILLRLKAAGPNDDDVDLLSTQVRQKLVELRTYLERGIRPLESRLKYQIDSALKAAENEELRGEKRKEQKKGRTQTVDSGSDSELNDAKDDSDVEGEEEEDTTENALLYKPNLLAPEAPAKQDHRRALSTRESSQQTGVYKPPRVNPTAMPDPDRRDRDSEPRKRKSQLLNEYIDEEMSSAPIAQPSIGSNNTILDRGRGGKSSRDQQKERERIEYEERNFTRLPGQTKKERREARRKGQLESRDMFGGEDWTGLGGLGDRVSRIVAGAGRDKGGVLQRREKRRATEDMPRSEGNAIGEAFEKRRRILAGRADKKRKS